MHGLSADKPFPQPSQGPSPSLPGSRLSPSKPPYPLHCNDTQLGQGIQPKPPIPPPARKVVLILC